MPKGHIATLNGAPPLLLCHKVQQFQLSTCICNQHSPGGFVHRFFKVTSDFLQIQALSHPAGHECDQIRGPRIPSKSLPFPASFIWSCNSHRVHSFVTHLRNTCIVCLEAMTFLQRMLGAVSAVSNNTSATSSAAQPRNEGNFDLRSTGRDPSIQPRGLEKP